MPNPERFIEKSRTPAPEDCDVRLPLKLKTIIPENVEQLLEELRQKQGEFEEVVACWKCERPLLIGEIKFEWPVGPYSFYFPGAPAYQCEYCGKTYFPELVREALSACVEKELASRKPEAPPRNPRALAFAKRYRRGALS